MKDSQILSKILVDNYWHLVGHKSELMNDKDYIKLDLLNRNIVVFNDDGELLAFDNICPHRGTKFFSEDSGNQNIVCPYHGWSYRKGELKIPKKKEFSNCNLDEADLNKLNLDYCGDFIFVSFNPKQSLDEQLLKLKPILVEISIKMVSRIDLDYYEWSCDWPIAIENALEPYHISKVHPNTLSLLKLKKDRDIFYNENSIWKARINNKRIEAGMQKIHNDFDVDVEYDGYQSILIFPFSFLSFTYGFTYSLQNFFPGNSSEKTNFHSRLFSSKVNKNDLTEYFLNSTIKTNRKIFSEDENICSQVYEDAWNVEPLKFWQDGELRINHFREKLKYLLKKRETQ